MGLRHRTRRRPGRLRIVALWLKPWSTKASSVARGHGLALPSTTFYYFPLEGGHVGRFFLCTLSVEVQPPMGTSWHKPRSHPSTDGTLIRYDDSALYRRDTARRRSLRIFHEVWQSNCSFVKYGK